MCHRNQIVGLAALLVAFSLTACDRTVTYVEENNQATSCFNCHDDQNTFLVAAQLQWNNSLHASGLNVNRATSATCARCHASEGFVQWTKGQTVTGHTNPTVIHCFTCHQPHTNGNFSLRWTANAELLNGATYNLNAGNLCVACHHARESVDELVGTNPTARVTFPNSRWGPHHSNQGDMLIGSNGYRYAGYTYEQTAHRDATENGCVDCHKNNATRNNVVGGHSFNMRAMLEGTEIVNTGACVTCHGTVIPNFNIGGVQDSVNALVEHLGTLLQTAGLLGTNGLPRGGVTTSADSAGAVWNFLMAEEDRSHGVHNPKWIIGLLDSAIRYMTGGLSKPMTVAEAVKPKANAAD